MDQEPKPGPSPAGELQFDQVEYESAAPASATCAACHQPIRDAYYEVNGVVTCAACRDQLAQALSGGSRVRRVVRALVLGSIAAGVGAAIYYGVAAATNMEFGLIAILVGLMVGKAVRAGSDGRGGWFYQGMAMFLTYNAIVLTYVPFLINAAREHEAKKVAAAKEPRAPANADQRSPDVKAEPTAAPAAAAPKPRLSLVEFVAALAFVIGFIYAVPFLGGAQNLMGLIIIGIGLYEAWLLNRRVQVVFTGPYPLAPAQPAPPAKADHVEPGS
jgi:hypothetical protein